MKTPAVGRYGSRSQGKPAGGRIGFPYEHSPDGFIQRRESDWPTAIAIIKIVIEEGGSTMQAVIRIREELGFARTRTWLHHWIRSPLLRGHTCRDTRNQDGNRRRKNDPIGILYNTHESLFDDPELKAIDALKSVDASIGLHTRKRGRATQGKDYPLSGLVVCGRCGRNAHIKTVSKQNGKSWLYIMCGARMDSAIPCGGEYGVLKGNKRVHSTRYADADAAVLEALRNRGSELLSLSRSTEPQAIDPGISKLRSEIRNLEALKDPDLKSVIDKKTSDLNRLLLMGNTNSLDAKAEALISLCAIEHFWESSTDDEKRILYRDFVRSVSCDRDRIIVSLAV
ncbi:MAG: zinc ribbon domain-containing protein [Microcoleus sp.]